MVEWRYVTTLGHYAECSDLLVERTSTFADFWTRMEKGQLAKHLKEDAAAFQSEAKAKVALG